MGTKKGRAGKVYRIVTRSDSEDRFVSTFHGMRMESEGGRRVLTGEFFDLSHLFGILEHLNGLGVELLSVEAMPDEATARDLEPKP